MKCACGYEGIPTVHEPDGEKGRHWKCPACHTPCPLPLKHDPMPPELDGRIVCSQCGMWGKTSADLHTECPGHGAHWDGRVVYCICGEWERAPIPPAKTLNCRRCGVEYPHHLRADYVPPEPDIVARARAVMKELTRVISDAEKGRL